MYGDKVKANIVGENFVLVLKFYVCIINTNRNRFHYTVPNKFVLQ